MPQPLCSMLGVLGQNGLKHNKTWRKIGSCWSISENCERDSGCFLETKTMMVQSWTLSGVGYHLEQPVTGTAVFYWIFGPSLSWCLCEAEP